MKYFKPDVILNRVFDLDTNKLKKNGVKAIIFDIDNTLAYNDEPEPSREMLTFLKSLESQGFRIALVSNNNKNRVTTYNKNLNYPHIFRACKPLKFNLKKILRLFDLKSGQVCMVGDQLFTDIWGGKRMGMFTVLVCPFDDKEGLFIRLKRRLENVMLK